MFRRFPGFEVWNHVLESSVQHCNARPRMMSRNSNGTSQANKGSRNTGWSDIGRQPWQSCEVVPKWLPRGRIRSHYAPLPKIFVCPRPCPMQPPHTSPRIPRRCTTLYGVRPPIASCV